MPKFRATLSDDSTLDINAPNQAEAERHVETLEQQAEDRVISENKTRQAKGEPALPSYVKRTVSQVEPTSD